MHTAVVRIRPDRVTAPVSRRVFGTFVEHMGRSVYTGIHEPGHPTADAAGFRQDVAELVRELGATCVRYPGGNFVSGYRWEDGVGPRDERPVRLDAAWRSLETNAVGLHEFAAWASEVGLELMMAVNLGTRGAAEAAELLEYANVDAPTARAQQRRDNGADEPFGITTWCLGNEMDGDWQIGHKTADEYGRLAAETARLMRFVDPSVELVLAGSSSAEMPTFGEWERTVLRHVGDLADHISLHAYYEEVDDVSDFLASSARLDRFIGDVATIVAEVEREQGLTKHIGISVDEWNVWRTTQFNQVDKEPLLTGPWRFHPRIIEDEYTATDAVVVGSLVNALLRHADRVKIANQAQLVNVIAPIRSEEGGPAWKQSIFHPFAIAAAHAHGDVIALDVDAPVLATRSHGEVPSLDAAATRTDDGVELFLANLQAEHDVDVTLDVDGYVAFAATTVGVPDGGDRLTTNTEASQPVQPRALAIVEGASSITLPALSWNHVRLRPVASSS
ncbi:alpha-N-arabinofuranosidase [Microbacterium marinilacus]|uniref:non-reducing end alpha-L-arabinofuranosidase n=1 Tax=Microbacterium marinilacus TaxID=415209 RepID=A0ABP7BSJ6_9MICO|nr:alpha-L-arabinofuranosidase C-terminal domain-containing protein [Microbacterium marinilacus]MBY0690394.1 alpha-L-arabinofuranosidase [Microbacterium marinilacus]